MLAYLFIQYFIYLCVFGLGLMAGSPCPIEVIKQVMIDLHMPDISVS